jgi:hypothetical protein
MRTEIGFRIVAGKASIFVFYTVFDSIIGKILLILAIWTIIAPLLS